MPRYFLHVQDGFDLLEDPEGAEFQDVAAAEHEAAQAARDLMAERLRSGAPLGLRREMVICNETGAVISTVPFASTIQGN